MIDVPLTFEDKQGLLMMMMMSISSTIDSLKSPRNSVPVKNLGIFVVCCLLSSRRKLPIIFIRKEMTAANSIIFLLDRKNLQCAHYTGTSFH
jgi:hypothetical protein